MKSNYKILAAALIFLSLPVYSMNSNRGLDGYEWQKIDASKNARLHSNMGNIYFEEKNYKSALKEYEIAYNLTANSSESAVYLYNIGKILMKIGYYTHAKKAFKDAINKDCINMAYYEAYADACVKTKTYNKELTKALNDTTNPYNRIIAGLIYYKTEKKGTAKAVFDEFINTYPKMIITEDVKLLLKNIE